MPYAVINEELILDVQITEQNKINVVVTEDIFVIEFKTSEDIIITIIKL